MRAFILYLATIPFAVFVLVGGLVGQMSPKEKAQVEVVKWQTRVDDLTTEIVSESAAVSDSERALYLALLAKLWWNVNQKEARVHLKAAADKLLSGFRTDDNTNAPNRTNLTEGTLEIITKLDEKFAQELVGQIEVAVNDSSDNNRKENPEMAELFAALGLQVVKKKPEVAMAFGFNSLTYGLAKNLPTLISELNIQDSTKAELLYRRALAKMQGNYSSRGLLFESLIGRYLFGVYGDKGFSEQIRREFIASYADRVAAAALVETERPTRCRIAAYASVTLAHIDEYIPAQARDLRQNIQTCTPYLLDVLQELSKAQTNADQPKTVDDFVRLAKETHDKTLKIFLLLIG